MLAQGTEVGVGGQSEGPWRWWGVQAHTWQQEMLGVICRSPLRRGGTDRERRGHGEGWVPRTAQGQRALRQAGRSLRSWGWDPSGLGREVPSARRLHEG